MASKDHNAIVEISEIDMPDTTISAKEAFDLDIDMEMPAFSEKTEYVPDLDETYCFDHDTTLAIMVAFAHNRRLLIQGYHGTGKSTHVEQVAARLNWPCIRVNLDSHISRIAVAIKSWNSCNVSSFSCNPPRSAFTIFF